MGRKLNIFLAGLVLSPFVLVGSCQIEHRLNWAGLFPAEINVGRSMVYQPGCFLVCAGGALYTLSDNEAAQIKSGGLAYLNSLPLISKSGRHIGTWEIGAPAPEEWPYFSKRNSSDPKKRFFTAIKEQTCFVSDRWNEPLLILCPDANLAYAGWID